MSNEAQELRRLDVVINKLFAYRPPAKATARRSAKKKSLQAKKRPRPKRLAAQG